MPIEYLLKRPFDLVLALLGLLISSPLWLVIAAAIYIEDQGPIFFLQDRCGLHGKSFKLIKFRSMWHSVDKSHDVVIMENDPRVTKVGRIIRSTAMDELPSLLNILKGDMSFVGPRAEPFVIDGVDITKVPGYNQRIRLRPGLTGIAQIYASRYVMLDEKFAYDIKYLEKIGLCFDIKLILLSCWVTLRGKWEQSGKRL